MRWQSMATPEEMYIIVTISQQAEKKDHAATGSWWTVSAKEAFEMETITVEEATGVKATGCRLIS